MFKKFSVILVLLLFIISTFGLWFYRSSQPVSQDESTKDFLIVKGTSASEIGSKLKEEGLIKSSLAFKFYVQLTDKEEKIQAGEYSILPSDNLFKIVDALLAGPKEIWVTIPEGLRKEEQAAKLATALGRSNSNFEGEFLKLATDKEGYLFPDTYLFPKEVKVEVIVNKMVATFEKRVDAKMKEDTVASGFSLDEIVTMASIIERETKTVDERPVVAGILYKRLKAGWPLQADATVQYAVANSKIKTLNSKPNNWWLAPSVEDKEIDSTYNTYKYKGLPPAPIANPGLSSIRAAIYPSDSPYWFYIHDDNGKIYYAETIEEHNENVRSYLGN